MPKPDRFHKHRVAERGVFSGCDSLNRICCATLPDRLARLARLTAVREPMP